MQTPKSVNEVEYPSVSEVETFISKVRSVGSLGKESGAPNRGRGLIRRVYDFAAVDNLRPADNNGVLSGFRREIGYPEYDNCKRDNDDCEHRDDQEVSLHHPLARDSLIFSSRV